SPIRAKEFYAKTTQGKKVIFPGGFVVSGPHIHLAYGKNDCEIWIVTLDKKLLKESLIPIGNRGQVHVQHPGGNAQIREGAIAEVRNYSMPNLFK
ncbi:MAG: hypothetical protein LLG04_11490, partial [Parachlamydia sp.]|nr:hypothetical protein [Parachlamydia sp.]